MSRKGWYRDIERAIKTCDEVLKNSFSVEHVVGPVDADAKMFDVEKELIKVVKKEDVEKIKKILKNITITSMPF